MSYPPPPGGPEGGQPGGPPPPGSGPPPPQPPWGPSSYGYGYGGYGMPQAHPQGTTAFVLGIIGLVGGLACWLPILLCIPAWVLGHKARQEVQQNPQAYSNAGLITAGWVLGIVGTCLLILGVAFIALLVIIGAASG